MRSLAGRVRHDLQVAATALAVVVAFACMAAPSSAQGATDDAAGAVPSCASKLAPCGGYLNATTSPPASCCGPLKEAAANETACMCSILMNKAVLQAFGVAPEQGLLLAMRCGVTNNASACAKSSIAGAGTATAGSTAASSATTATGTAASTVAKPMASGGAMHRLSLIGASSLVGFKFIWWTLMAQ